MNVHVEMFPARISSEMTVFRCDAGSTAMPPEKRAPHMPNVPYVRMEWFAWHRSARSGPETSGAKFPFR
jgi:hypothetical protein